MEPNVTTDLFIQIALNLKGDDFINFIKTHKNVNYDHNFWTEKFENDQLPILTHLLPVTTFGWLKEYTKVYKINEAVDKYMKNHLDKISTDEDINKYPDFTTVQKSAYYLPVELLNSEEVTYINQISGLDDNDFIVGEEGVYIFYAKEPLIKLKLMQIYYYVPNVYNHIMNFYEYNRYYQWKRSSAKRYWLW